MQRAVAAQAQPGPRRQLAVPTRQLRPPAPDVGASTVTEPARQRRPRAPPARRPEAWVCSTTTGRFELQPRSSSATCTKAWRRPAGPRVRPGPPPRRAARRVLGEDERAAIDRRARAGQAAVERVADCRARRPARQLDVLDTHEGPAGGSTVSVAEATGPSAPASAAPLAGPSKRASRAPAASAPRPSRTGRASAWSAGPPQAPTATAQQAAASRTGYCWWNRVGRRRLADPGSPSRSACLGWGRALRGGCGTLARVLRTKPAATEASVY